MDAITKALMAIDEIPRTETDWRDHFNNPPRYEYRSCLRPVAGTNVSRD